MSSYEYTMEYIPGTFRASCSICGMSYHYNGDGDDGLVRCDDGLYRCKRTCMEETPLARDRKIAMFRQRREVPPPRVGLRPPFDPEAP